MKADNLLKMEEILANEPGAACRCLMELSSVSVVLLDRDMAVLDCNRGFTEMLGLDAKPIGMGVGGYMEGLEPPADGEFNTTVISLAGGSGARTSLKAHITAQKEGYLLFAEKLPLPSPDDAASLRAELGRVNSELARLRNTDPLTGLTNFDFFMGELKKAVSLARRGEMPLSLIICDLDNFKFVEDTYGREVADKVLVAFARIMDDNTREEDTPARFRGDEFSLLLPNTPSGHAVRCAERMWQNVRDLQVEGVKAKLSASFGITELAGEDTVESLIERAESAVFRAKTAHPKNVTVV